MERLTRGAQPARTRIDLLHEDTTMLKLHGPMIGTYTAPSPTRVAPSTTAAVATTRAPVAAPVVAAPMLVARVATMTARRPCDLCQARGFHIFWMSHWLWWLPPLFFFRFFLPLFWPCAKCRGRRFIDG